MWAAAATAGAPTDVAAYLLTQGPVGVLALVIGTIGWLAWKRERDRADAADRRSDTERAGKDALAREIIDKVVPALVESTRAVHDATEEQRDRDREHRRRD